MDSDIYRLAVRWLEEKFPGRFTATKLYDPFPTMAEVLTAFGEFVLAGAERPPKGGTE